MKQEYSIFEDFLDVKKRHQSTHDFASKGYEAIPILEDFFIGKAKNQYGIPYLDLGQPLYCSLVVCGMLGRKAVTLLKYIEQHLHLEYAVEAKNKINKDLTSKRS